MRRNLFVLELGSKPNRRVFGAPNPLADRCRIAGLTLWALFTVVQFLLFSASTAAQLPDEMYEEGRKYAQVELVRLHDELQIPADDSQTFSKIGVRFRIEPGWHIYWKNSGESAIPTQVKLRASNGWQIGKLQWPAPEKLIERGDIIAYGYRDETLLIADLEAVSPEAYRQNSVEIEAEVEWLICKDKCVPGRVVTQTTLPLTSGPTTTSNEQPLFVSYGKLLPKALTEVRRTPGFADVNLSVTHNSHASAGSTLDAILEISNLPFANPAAAASDPGQLAQVFPDPIDFIDLKAPTAAVVDRKLLIHLPLRVLPSEAFPKDGDGSGPSVASVSGVVTLSGQALGLPDDKTIRWDFPVTLTKLPTEAAQRPEIIAQLAAQKFSPLTFRLKHAVEPETSAQTAAAGTENPVLILLFAFLGGLLLNLMPCVLPVIGIKVMGLLGHCGDGDGSLSPKEARKNAIAFATGILLTLTAFGVVVVALRAAGVSIGWGSQFQYPPYVLALVVIVFVLGLGFFDVYCVSLPFLQGFNNRVDSMGAGISKHFFDGVLATALSTPCTAPFMGTALVFAFSQSTLMLFAVFGSIGLGLAAPYVFLVTHPTLLQKLPKPGMWMVHLRQVMGFMLLATVLWLLFVLQSLTGPGVIWSLAILLAVFFCFWLRQISRTASPRVRLIAKVVILLTLVASAVLLLPKATRLSADAGAPTNSVIDWVPFAESALETARTNGQPVFIDFTADWCLTCKANEALIIETAPVIEALQQYRVVPVKADWTRADPAVSEALTRYGGRGVPLYVVLSPDRSKPPTVLSTIPSQQSLVDAFRDAADSSL